MRLGLLNRSVPYWNVAWMMYCDFNLLTSSSLTSILLRPISSNLNNYTIGHLLFLLFFILHPFSLLVFFSSVWFSLNLWCFRIIPFPPFFFPPFLVSFLVTFLYYFLPWLFPLCVVYCVGTGWQLSLVSAVRHLFKMYSSACWYVYIRTFSKFWTFIHRNIHVASRMEETIILYRLKHRSNCRSIRWHMCFPPFGRTAFSLPCPSLLSNPSCDISCSLSSPLL